MSKGPEAGGPGQSLSLGEEAYVSVSGALSEARVPLCPVNVSLCHLFQKAPWALQEQVMAQEPGMMLQLPLPSSWAFVFL